MRKAMVLLASLMAGMAFAAPTEDEHAASGHAAPQSHLEKEEEDVAGYILHHVSDSSEYEIEVPGSYDHPAIHLPQFGIPLRAGVSCAPRPTPDGHGMAVPSWSEGCLDMSISKHTVMMWLAAALLIGSLLVFGSRDKS